LSCTRKSLNRKFIAYNLSINEIGISSLKNFQRNIFAKGEKRVILGEIGFKHEIDLFRKNSKNAENILYYPNEYFNENIDKISLSFDIWSLGVVFWSICQSYTHFSLCTLWTF